jgi:tRNA(Ile)-lysidine synthase
LRLGRRAARAETALAARLAAFAASLDAVREAGRTSLPLAPLASEPEEIVLRLLEREIEAVAGAAAPVRLERLEALTLRLRAAIGAEASFAGSLGGAVLRIERGRLTLRAEHRRPPRRDDRPA